MLTNKLIQQIRGTLGENLVLPDSTLFDSLRSVWNAAIDRRPMAIARCRNTQDVIATLAAANQSNVPVSIRAGGHNIAGTAVADEAIMIDLSEMCIIDIEPTQKIARVEGGATWASFDAAAQIYGLAAPGGVVSSTGVAGLTLGGGFGWLARLHGLAADNLISAEVVLADGLVIEASANSHPDLFWALRGGGGNFGVVTSFTFQLHRVGPQVWFGPTFFSLDDAKTVLSAYARHAPLLQREACVWANLMTAPQTPVLDAAVHGKKVLALMQFHSDSSKTSREQLKVLYGGVTPLGDALAPRPFTEAQSFLDVSYASGARNYWRAHNHTDLSDNLIDTLIALTAELPTPESEILIAQLGGAISDVTPGATAFPHRQIPFVTTPSARWQDQSDDAAVTNWLKIASAKIKPHAAPGAYVNFIAERSGRTHDAYGSNLVRLEKIKHRYDPKNVFRVNQNIVPAASTVEQ